MKTVLTGIALTLTLASGVTSAGQFDSLKGLAGGSSGSLTSGSMGNAAGILQYCVTNNYLGGDSGASGVKDQLLGKLGGKSSEAAPTQDTGYLDGAKGLLKSKDGKTVDLGGAAGADSSPMGDAKAKITKKICSAVLKQGKGMLGGMGK
ncbi:MAG TPA: DUF2501 domain-containing protein [Luteibacter sp.]|uniref:DUF2501 domain-containing protein n=1 Tax=Luteibacter sp. TaxID=1886636 RepID=UPI002C97561C|nr:DUF2501 domain-containing protein [Luteibacter sp.]HVI56887.1 DUF2501 domain-containing protein [Luteibacter sp.]